MWTQSSKSCGSRLWVTGWRRKEVGPTFCGPSRKGRRVGPTGVVGPATWGEESVYSTEGPFWAIGDAPAREPGGPLCVDAKQQGLWVQIVGGGPARGEVGPTFCGPPKKGRRVGPPGVVGPATWGEEGVCTLQRVLFGRSVTRRPGGPGGLCVWTQSNKSCGSRLWVRGRREGKWVQPSAVRPGKGGAWVQRGSWVRPRRDKRGCRLQRVHLGRSVTRRPGGPGGLCVCTQSKKVVGPDCG